MPMLNTFHWVPTFSTTTTMTTTTTPITTNNVKLFNLKLTALLFISLTYPSNPFSVISDKPFSESAIQVSMNFRLGCFASCSQNLLSTLPYPTSFTCKFLLSLLDQTPLLANYQCLYYHIEMYSSLYSRNSYNPSVLQKLVDMFQYTLYIRGQMKCGLL